VLVRGRNCDIPGVGGTARDELGDDIGLALARGVYRLEHRPLIDDPVLHQTLGQSAKAGACGRQRSIVIHGLMASGTSLIVSVYPSEADAQLRAIVKSHFEARFPRESGYASHLGAEGLRDALQ